jgi:pimeloyl-ACP methyl ester carboxylesterase
MRKLLVILICIITIPLLLLVFHPDITTPKQDVKQELSSPHSHFLHWNEAEVHYTDEGKGTPVLMIHGLGGSYTHFNKLAELMKDDYRIIRVDLPGFGLSDLPKLSAGENYVQKYEEYLQFLFDTLQLDSVYVIGNSLGGMVTWVAAAKFPAVVKKIVLLSPAGYDLEKVLAAREKFRYDFMQWIAARGMSLSMSRAGLRKAYFNDDKVEESYVRLINRFVNIKGNIPNKLKIVLSESFPDTALLQNIQCPTLIVWGREDAVIPVAHAERFHRDVKNSEVVILDSMGHCPMLEAPQKTSELCVRFFETQ